MTDRTRRSIEDAARPQGLVNQGDLDKKAVPICAYKFNPGESETRVYCAAPDCLNTVIAQCQHDQPTCKAHGNGHTCHVAQRDRS